MADFGVFWFFYMILVVLRDIVFVELLLKNSGAWIYAVRLCCMHLFLTYYGWPAYTTLYHTYGVPKTILC
jgi:succinate-acetate transporter protein